MTIQRIGTSTDRVEHDLGSVLVTIDDLQALRELLAKSQPEHTLPEVHFSGGNFDDSGDIRFMAGPELASLSLRTEAAEVVLSTSRAKVVGNTEIATAVCNWARSRQFKQSARVRMGTFRLWYAVAMVAFCAYVAGSFMASNMATYDILNVLPRSSAVRIFTLVAYGAVILWSFLGLLDTPSATRVLPITLEQYRQERTSRKRHWQVATISLAGICIALIGIVVSNFVSK